MLYFEEILQETRETCEITLLVSNFRSGERIGNDWLQGCVIFLTSMSLFSWSSFVCLGSKYLLHYDKGTSFWSITGLQVIQRNVPWRIDTASTVQLVKVILQSPSFHVPLAIVFRTL